jgi:hypothetical protein
VVGCGYPWRRIFWKKSYAQHAELDYGPKEEPLRTKAGARYIILAAFFALSGLANGAGRYRFSDYVGASCSLTAIVEIKLGG